MRFELLVTVSKKTHCRILAFVGDLNFNVKSWPKFGTCGKFHIKYSLRTHPSLHTSHSHVCMYMVFGFVYPSPIVRLLKEVLNNV